MKKLKILVFIAFSFSVSYFSKAQKVVGYMDVNLSEASVRVNQMNWSHMTDFIYGFITPDNSGNLPDPTGLTLFTEIKQKCIDNGVDLHFSSGGATNSGMFHTIGQNATATANFANEIADAMITHGMVGWDLDWEFPRSAAEQISQVNILKAVHDEFTSRGKRDEWHIAIAVGGETPSVGIQGVYHTDYCSANAFQYIDYLNMMSYDIGRNISGDYNHSSYADAVNNVIDWNNKGCPIEKMVLGVPFYARHKTSRGLPPGGFYDITYGTMSNDDPVTYFNQDFKGDYYYNGAPTLKQKVDYIMQAGGVGVMIWEVTYDRFDSYSLLKSLHDEMDKYRCDAPAPDLGNDFSFCGSSSITLDGGVAAEAGLTFTWKDASGTLVDQSATASTYDIVSPGVYTLEVWKDGCEISDEVTITGIISTPNIGDSYELCDPASVTLDAGSVPIGHSFQWQFNDENIYGATNQLFEAKKAGTYKIVVSANGCASVTSSFASVTSEVPYAETDTVCNAGDEANIEASETVKWYNSEIAEYELITGQIFSPVVANNTTYWMGGTGSGFTQYTTLKSVINSEWGTVPSHYGRKITVNSELNIDAVSVSVSDGGSLKMNLKASDGSTILKTLTLNVNVGEQEIILDWNSIQAGDYYIDAFGSTAKLLIDQEAPDDDFEIPGIFFSEANNYGNWGSYSAVAFYGFFFNLKLTAGKECARVPVSVVLDSNGSECLTVDSKTITTKDVSVFPNPSSTNFSISEFSGDIQIFDCKGILVEEVFDVQSQFIFGNYLEQGVYFLKLKSSFGTQTKKVVKE
jgi:hypothetical protein